MYRACLAEPRPDDPATALRGLAEVAAPPDAALAERFLGARSARVRAVAVRCFGRLDAARGVDRLLAALEDPSPRVVRAAAALLAPHVPPDAADRLVALADGARDHRFRRPLFRLALASAPWALLPSLVRRLAGGDDGERLWAGSLVDTWLRRSRGWTTPPPAHRVEALRASLREVGASLGPRRRRELEFLLAALDRS